MLLKKAASRLRKFRVISILLAWIDPLHLARWFLYQAIQQRAYHAQGFLLDIGCGEKPYRELFSHVEQYIGMDIPPNGKADIQGDAMSLPFRAASFHTILCNEVLEHVPEPSIVMEEALRVLKEGGILILTTPQTWGLHHEPHDFYRYTKYGLKYLSEKSNFEVIEITPTCGFWATFTQRMADTVIYTYACGQSKWIVRFLSILLAPVLLTGYVLDRLFGRRGDTLDHVLVAKKSDMNV